MKAHAHMADRAYGLVAERRGKWQQGREEELTGS